MTRSRVGCPPLRHRSALNELPTSSIDPVKLSILETNRKLTRGGTGCHSLHATAVKAMSWGG